MSARARRPSFRGIVLEGIRLAFAHLRRVSRMQRLIGRATPTELDFYEALASGFAIGRSRLANSLTAAETPATAVPLEPVTVAPAPPRALDAAEIEECEKVN